VPQSYTAYTPALDDVNAEALKSENAPTLILRQWIAIDGRNPAWESPAANFQFLCHYQQVRADGDWYLYERVPNRCGTTKHLASTNARFGRPVNVPTRPAGSMITMRIEHLPSVWERLRNIVFKPSPTYLQFSADGAVRVLPQSARNPMVLSTPNDAMGTVPRRDITWFTIEKRCQVNMCISAENGRAGQALWESGRRFRVDFYMTCMPGFEVARRARCN
jgi:hypothetical protein